MEKIIAAGASLPRTRIAVVVPTIRYDTEYRKFLQAWHDLFVKHEVILITVIDGDEQRVVMRDYWSDEGSATLQPINHPVRELVQKKTPACRNLGFLHIAMSPIFRDVGYIITLDDDTGPWGDPIQDHMNALSASYPISWLSSTAALPDEVKPLYMRGFPYGVRNEAECWVSHGTWLGVPDLDAPTQLVIGERPFVDFYRGPVPKGIYLPFCGMNVAFKRAALPYMYWAPVANFEGAGRFDDIWLGVSLVRDLAVLNKALVTGYAQVRHDRASNVFTNLSKEHLGMKMHEMFWQGKQQHQWFDFYSEMRLTWRTTMETWV